MRVRRCSHLMVELDQAPRFSLDTLFQGGDGLDRSARWLAHAPHLAAPVEIKLHDLAALEALPDGQWLDVDGIDDRDGAIARLVASGILLTDEPGQDQARRRDDNARDIAWWTPAVVAQANGAWEAVDIEDRGSKGLMLSSQQMVEAFGAAPEPDFRRAGDRPVRRLAPPLATPFDDLLAARRTCRNFDPAAALEATAFATMMRRVWGALGTKTLAPGAVAVKKTSPAGGGLHAVEAYVLVQRVEGLEPGFYHYLSMQHALEPLQSLSPAEAASWAHRFVAGQDWFRDVPAMVVMVARFDRLFWKYRRHTKAWRVLHLDVGHLSQTMYLSATELGLGCFVTAAINDRDIERALALPPLREGAIALVGFGPRAAEVKTLELDVFDPVRPAHLAAG